MNGFPAGSAAPLPNAQALPHRVAAPSAPAITRPYAEGRQWYAFGWVLAGIVTMAVAISIVRIPIQVTDGLVPMLQVQAAESPTAVFVSTVREEGYLRPLWWTQVKVLFDAAGSSYFLTFKGFHVALVFALISIFMALARPRTLPAVMALAFAMTVLTGLHTFTGMVWEAFPINHYLEIAVLCLAALWVADSRGGLWADLALPLLCAGAALILESGLIVWVIVVMARLVGMRGASRKAVAATTAVVIGYAWLRFWYLDIGTPGLSERSTGFGLSRLERGDVLARFGDTPYELYFYNVISSLFSVFFSEPRAGVWVAAAGWLRGNLTPSSVVNVLSSLGATLLLAIFIASRLRSWWARDFSRADQIVLVSLAVIAANATISFAYTKDDVLSTAGVFYALAVFVAASSLLQHMTNLRRAAPAVALALCCLLLGSAWASRAIGLHYRTYYMSYTVRLEWAEVDQWLAQQEVVPSADGRALVNRLQSDAITSPVVNDFFLPRWARRWWEE